MQAPLEIRNDRANAELRLHWADGSRQVLGHSLLRQGCRCAHCKSRRLRGDAPPAAAHIRALHMQGYGLQIVFDDGHDRGIFPWEYLRSLG